MGWDDPSVVRSEYASEVGLMERASIYAHAHGENPVEIALGLLAEMAPSRVLEIGCGTGALAERVAQLTGADLRAVDLSPRMVELARGRGVAAAVGDVQDLPFSDDAFDCVIAAWMLYHVPDLERGLQEIARVLTPGGQLMAITNSGQHLRELWALVDRPDLELSFSAENAESMLSRYFQAVRRRDVHGTVTFQERGDAHRYIASGMAVSYLADRLPPFDDALVATRHSCIFVATAP